MKARRRAHGRLAAPDAAHEPATDSSPDARLHTARLKRALEAVMADLPERTRTILILRFQQELTYEELAARLGEAPGTLQRRVARALPVIRAALIRAGFSPVGDSQGTTATK
jgi:RNA polymerase sigma-70 factor (ECF subfamily)